MGYPGSGVLVHEVFEPQRVLLQTRILSVSGKSTGRCVLRFSE